MDLLKKIKFWRGLDKITSSTIGAPIVEAIRKPTNWGATWNVNRFTIQVETFDL